MRGWIAVALLLGACAQPEPQESGPIDARVEVPAPPEGGAQFLGVEAEVPPLAEKMTCTFFTWQGGEVGLRGAQSYQHPDYGHHAILLKTTTSEYTAPDGTVMDCTDEDDFSMVQTDQLYIPEPLDEGRTGMRLPEGMAVKLEPGQRLVLQSHYINYEDRPLVVQDGVNLDLVESSAVDTWAAAFAHTTLDLELPPGEESTVELDCGWERDVDLLYLIGHMHERGTSFAVDHDYVEGGSETVYEVEQWTDYHRDAPPVHEYARGEFSVKAGDSFRTRCTWYNDTDETLGFPAEMCATVGIAYPAEESLYCAEI